MEDGAEVYSGELASVLQLAVDWAEANIPAAFLPEWVFQAEMALAHAAGKQVTRGRC